MAPKIAVIGSGISGLSAAWLLSKSADVTLIENAPRLGGHINTVLTPSPEGPVAVDTGFIVYNEKNYPNLTALFARLGVETAESDMSFAVSMDRGRMEYSGRSLNGLFGQRRNIVRPRHWQMVADILRFFRWAERHAADVAADMGMGEFLKRYNYSDAFIEDHMLPICAAIWSTPARSMLDFPARTFVRFFANHGLLQVSRRPLWRTVCGGASTYVDRLVADGRFTTAVNTHIAAIARDAEGVDLLFADGEQGRFQQVVFACHPDQALRLLVDASPEERNLLSSIRYTANRAVLHTDKSFMPRRRPLWSAWNYLRTGSGTEADLSLTYWMNRLQPLPTSTDFFVTLNPMHAFAPETIRHVIDYEHPVFDARAMAAQHGMGGIQGVRRTWFAGAWLGHGFHEDGLQSGLEVAERLGAPHRPWVVAGARDRIAASWAEAPVPWQAA